MRSIGGKFSLTQNFSQKLNRESALKAKDEVVRNELFKKVVTQKDTIDQIMDENQKKRRVANEETAKYQREGKDPLQASMKLLAKA